MKKNLKLITLLSFTLFLLFNSVIIVSAQGIAIEPAAMRSDLGGTLSIYARGTLTFSPQSTVRLVGYGILPGSYVNPTALQANVPTGLAVGTYTLSVLDANGVQVATDTLTITAAPVPTATPKPDTPPKAGRPILTIRNYTIDPPQVKPGQEFTVSVEVYNNGSRAGENTMAIFPGGTFVPLGENGHLFWQVHINHTFVATQRMRAPKEIGNGIHQLSVNLSANDWEGSHYDFPQTVTVEVIGASSGAAFTGKPELVIENSHTEPAIIAPGSPFTLTLNIANRGSRTAINVTASADTASIIPTQGSGIASGDIIRIDNSITLTLPLQLKTGQEGGRQGLAITLGSSDYGGGNHSAQQTVGLDIDTSLANRPQLLIDGYRTEPEKISPGDTFTLTLQLSNVGGGAAQRLTMALGGEGGEQLGAFIPVEGSNVKFIAKVSAGSTEEITLSLLTTGNAETKAHNLPIELAYDTGSGTREKDTQRVSLMVQRRPKFNIKFYRPVENIMVGQPFAVPIEIVNAGTASFNIPELSAHSDMLEFQEENTTYVGQLAPDGSWTLDTMAVALQSGPLDVTIEVHYVDDLHKTQVYSEVLSIDVIENPSGPEDPFNPNGNGNDVDPFATPEAQPETFIQKVGRFVKGILGLGS